MDTAFSSCNAAVRLLTDSVKFDLARVRLFFASSSAMVTPIRWSLCHESSAADFGIVTLMNRPVETEPGMGRGRMEEGIEDELLYGI